MIQSRLFRRLCVAATLTLAIPAFASKEKKEPPPPPTNLVWPLPPEKPRIKFLDMYSNNFDIEPRKKQSWVDKMVGNADPNKTELFYQPAGIATDSKGRVYLVSTQRATVYVIDKEKHQVGRLLGDRGIVFRVPIGAAIDSRDNLYVADAKQRLILKFNPDHTLAATFGADELGNPTYLALDESRRRLYVVDSRLHQVLVYNLETLLLETKVGKRGTKNGEFNFPIAIAVAPNGNFAVTDTGSCSVEIFGPDYKFIRRFGKQGTRPGEFVRPKGISFDSEGHLWVVDAAFNNFQIFDDQGQVLLFVGTFGQKPGEFNLPAGIFIDRNDRVFVSDQLNHRVQVFQFLGGK